MKNGIKEVFSLIVAGLLFASFPAVAALEYDALKGVKSARAVFDVRLGNPQSAAIHLKLMHQTYNDLAAGKRKPAFKIVFLGPAVKLISSDRTGYATPEDNKALDEIAAEVSAMSKDGIHMEICLVAAKIFKVDPATVLPEIKPVENGWISLIGYQAREYSLVTAY
ncbi:MAG TPA: DsrE family protein [Gallionella sp.]